MIGVAVANADEENVAKENVEEVIVVRVTDEEKVAIYFAVEDAKEKVACWVTDSMLFAGSAGLVAAAVVVGVEDVVAYITVVVTVVLDVWINFAVETVV